MTFLQEYGSYWSVFAGTLLFFLLGFWFRRTALHAAELTPKPLDWVRNYRSGCYPFGKERFGLLKLSIGLFVALFASAGFAIYASFMVSKILKLEFSSFSNYYSFSIILRTLGAGAVYLLLQLLLRSPRVALPGALLFAASSVRGHNDACLFALSLLLLLLYLRSSVPGFLGELLYLSACLAFSAVLALRPALIWLLLCFPAAHWYKLRWMLREGRLSWKQSLGFTAAALAIWALVVLLAMLLHFFLLNGFRLQFLLNVLRRTSLRLVSRDWFSTLQTTVLRSPTRGMVLELLLDAPLLGFGFWGCFSAWRLGIQRRNVQGLLILILFAALILIWLLNSVYLLTFPLTLCTACFLREADLGQKRWICVTAAAAGLCWYLIVLYSASAAPLTAGLLERIR